MSKIFLLLEFIIKFVEGILWPFSSRVPLIPSTSCHALFLLLVFICFISVGYFGFQPGNFSGHFDSFHLQKHCKTIDVSKDLGGDVSLCPDKAVVFPWVRRRWDSGGPGPLEPRTGGRDLLSLTILALTFYPGMVTVGRVSLFVLLFCCGHTSWWLIIFFHWWLCVLLKLSNVRFFGLGFSNLCDTKVDVL